MQALTEEYQLFESAVMDSQLNLAMKINETIYQSVSYAYKTDNPVLTLSQQRLLARKSLELAPELERTYSIFARLCLVSRDFEPIYSIPANRSNMHVHHYSRLARLYESMQFPDPSAPHPEELSQYITSLKRLVVNYSEYVLQSNIIANMIHYDWYRADDKHLYITPIIALLERIAPTLTTSYSPTENSLTLTTRNNTIFQRHDHDILSLLYLDTLSIRAPSFDLSYIHHATISHLNLRRLYQIQFTEPIYLNDLVTLSVSADAPSDQFLRQHIKSQQPYTIVRK